MTVRLCNGSEGEEYHTGEGGDEDRELHDDELNEVDR